MDEKPAASARARWLVGLLTAGGAVLLVAAVNLPGQVLGTFVILAVRQFGLSGQQMLLMYWIQIIALGVGALLAAVLCRPAGRRPLVAAGLGVTLGGALLAALAPSLLLYASGTALLNLGKGLCLTALLALSFESLPRGLFASLAGLYLLADTLPALGNVGFGMLADQTGRAVFLVPLAPALAAGLAGLGLLAAARSAGRKHNWPAQAEAASPGGPAWLLGLALAVLLCAYPLLDNLWPALAGASPELVSVVVYLHTFSWLAGLAAMFLCGPLGDLLEYWSARSSWKMSGRLGLLLLVGLALLGGTLLLVARQPVLLAAGIMLVSLAETAVRVLGLALLAAWSRPSAWPWISAAYLGITTLTPLLGNLLTGPQDPNLSVYASPLPGMAAAEILAGLAILAALAVRQARRAPVAGGQERI